MMAKRSIGDTAVDRMYQQTLKEAPHCADAISFFGSTCGGGPLSNLTFTEEGLSAVESLYRTLCSADKFTADMSREMFEELMVYFLGETLIRGQEAEWYAYKGKTYTIRPILIRFPDQGKSVDVSAFCRDLVKKKVAGASEGRALVEFYKKAKSLAFI